MARQASKHSQRAPSRGAAALRAGGRAPVSLGERDTPLIDAEECWLKCEQANPTGSFKDRIASLALGVGLAEGAAGWVGSSSGNAGLAFSAYGARAGAEGILLVPPSISRLTVAQAELFGTRVVAVEGFLTDPDVDAAVFEALRRLAAKRHLVLAITARAYNPVAMDGAKAIAFEILEQLGRAPAAVFVPIGGGGLIASLWLGFQEGVQQGLAERTPRLIGAQPSSCAPIHEAFVRQLDKVVPLNGIRSSIAGVGLPAPPDGDLALAALRHSDGLAVSVPDDLVLAAQRHLARHVGVIVEPAAALAYAAFEQTRIRDAVVVLTGRGGSAAVVGTAPGPIPTVTVDQIEAL